MNTISLWEHISERGHTYPNLTQDIEVDVAIIGAGITAITAANQLVQAGKKVAIIEAHKIGGVTTGYSTGNLYIATQPFYQHIVKKFNFETAKAVAYSRKFAIDYIEKNIQDKNISCNFFRRPWYGYTSDHERISLDKEVELIKKMDLAIDYVNDMPIKIPFTKAIVMPEQARFNPLQYVISQARYLAHQGCLIFEDTRVTAIHEKDKCILETEKGKVIAQDVFMATHTPVGINAAHMFTAPYRSYVVSAHLENLPPEGHFWDLDRPPHYICTHPVTQNHPELIMVAGGHHKVGQAEDTRLPYKELENFLRQHFAIQEIAYQWSAQHYQSADKVPYIGLASRSSKHTYLATGFFADGLVYGTIGGILVADLILQNANPSFDTFNSTRFDPIASAHFFIKENANNFLQYMKKLKTPPKEYEDIRPGEGKIVEINKEKCAVARDDNNQLHVVSAICTHLKCLVSWNTAEKTWDCPCHGSRFHIDGKVIEGPALSDLEKKLI